MDCRPRDLSHMARSVTAEETDLETSPAEAFESYRAMSSANCTLGTGDETDFTSRV